MIQLSGGLLSGLARLMRKPLTACVAIVLPLAVASGALAATSPFSQTSQSVSAAPDLTTNTNAGCNSRQPAGFMRCFAVIRTPSSHRITPDAAGPPSSAVTPADLQSAYNLPSATAGGGQTVAIVDAGDDPTAESDLAVFRSQYGLPACTTANACFTKVNQEGQQSNYPVVDGDWPTEESLDLDAVSSLCPKCNILLVEANSDATSDMYSAEARALLMGGKFISNSWGGSEVAGQDENWPRLAGVAEVASAGDSGYGVNFPSADPYVTAVGGTTLTKDSSVPRGWDETVWDHSGNGTGSGCSAYEPQPSFQQGIPALDAVCSNRATADVSADADPTSGLAVYDTTGEAGWLQVGGTSLASPLIAATYALAGTPAAGTYPNTYPYHDPNESSDLNDVTSGSNGDCGNVLCTAGAGWDGPTGLGTPDGTAAFQSGPQGTISGQVTDSATGQPIAGATVTAQPGNYVTRTDASGNYELSLEAGTYTSLTASDYGYQSATDSNVTVTANQTTTENLALTAEPSGTLTGRVTDGSGEGWPLHAEITVPGDPDSPFWTSPHTGKYSIPLPQGSYNLTVSTDYPGYKDKTVPVTVGARTTRKFTLKADLTTCTAPGYGPDGLTQSFTGWTGGTAQDGWTAASAGGAGWRFDDPGSRPPPPSASIADLAGTSDREFDHFDGDDFAVADAGYYAPRPLRTTLTSAPADLAGQAAPQISFDSAYYPAGGRDSASVQLSTDGGQHWSTVWQQSASNALGPITVAIPQAAGDTNVRARWSFTGGGLGYWAVGSVLIGTATCAPQPGGLITGTVTDNSSGSTVNGATVTSAASPAPYPWPEGTSLASSDPALPGGFYWLFAPAGSQRLSVTAAGYTAGTATVTVTKGQVSQKNWALSPAAGG
ncbi:MAG TPA: carboxypeptidase regulatory-like domain-containing protein [Streptosporangiaceae bacterium]|jgi:hypothetical protein